MAEGLIGVLRPGPLPSAAAFWLVSMLAKCMREMCVSGECHATRQTQVWDCGCAGGQAHAQLKTVSRVGGKASETKKLGGEGALSQGEGAYPGSPWW